MNSPNLLRQLSNHLLFRSLHYAFIASQLREELAKSRGAKGCRSCLQGQPFMIWLNHVMLTYAGDILVNILLGTLPLEPLSNVEDIMLCTAAWYIIFYIPFDCAYSLASSRAFRVLAAPITAISQVVHIDRAIQLGGKMYGNNALVPILIIGTVVGSGAEFLKPIAALLIHRCQLTNATYVKLSTNSKVSFCISGLYLLDLHRSKLLIGLNHQQLHVYALIMLISLKYLALAYRLDHLIWKLQNRVYYACFGGLYADLAKYFKRRTLFEKFV